MSAHVDVVCMLISDASNPLMDKVEITYNGSFPVEERRAFSFVRQLVEQDPRFKMFVLLRAESYVGFMTAWQFEDFTYAEHFAIDEAARNGGIGAKAMEQFLSVCGTPVVLEVELPVDEMSIRRIGFYERQGFVLDDHNYQQPPYRAGESWLDMRLMTYGAIDLSTSYEQVRFLIYKYVYGV